MEENTNANVNGVAQEVEGTTTEAAKTFTEEEVLKLIQSEADKRVSQALATQQKKYEKQLSLSKLDGAEREKAEKDAKIEELTQRLAEFQVEKNRSELKSVLSQRGLSAAFADIISITDDIESSQANIDKLDKLFKEAVKAEVEKRLSGTAPKGNGNGAQLEEYTEAKIKKMSLSELTKLKADNPEIYEKYFN